MAELDISREEADAVCRYLDEEGKGKQLNIVNRGTNDGPLYQVEGELVLFKMRPGPGFTFPGPRSIVASDKVLSQLREIGAIKQETETGESK